MDKGIKTSEFKAMVLYGAVLVANGTQYVNISQNDLQAFAAVVGAFIVGRSAKKWAEAKGAAAFANLGARVQQDLRSDQTSTRTTR